MPPAKDPPTKTCEHCGRTYHRKRSPTGKLEHSKAWRARRGCSHSCSRKIAAATALAKEPPHHCPICGTLVPRELNRKQRQTCGTECQNELIARIKTAQWQELQNKTEHPPCTHCGGEVPYREPERISKWLARMTCSPECAKARLNTGGRGGHRAYRSARRRSERQKLANPGYVFDGRFPTPPSVTTWQSVSGPDTGVTITTRHNGVTKSSATVAMLRSAVRAHPELGTALLGILSDSWVQQDAATYHG